MRDKIGVCPVLNIRLGSLGLGGDICSKSAVVMVELPQVATEALLQLFPTGWRNKDAPIP